VNCGCDLMYPLTCSGAEQFAGKVKAQLFVIEWQGQSEAPRRIGVITLPDRRRTWTRPGKYNHPAKATF
jgi:hypothetical protein